MAELGRIWNGKPGGVPGAAALAIAIAWTTVRHRVATLMARGNLGSLGPGSVVQAGVTIRYPGQVHIGAHTSLARGVELSSETDDGVCKIGSSVIVGVAVRLDFSGGLEIGDNSVISEHASIYTHGHGLDPKSEPSKAPLIIGRGVWIGSRALIKEGCSRIGNGAVVAAGSVVTREVPPYAVVAGVPARVIKARQ